MTNCHGKGFPLLAQRVLILLILDFLYFLFIVIVRHGTTKSRLGVMLFIISKKCYMSNVSDVIENVRIKTESKNLAQKT